MIIFIFVTSELAESKSDEIDKKEIISTDSIEDNLQSLEIQNDLSLQPSSASETSNNADIKQDDSVISLTLDKPTNFDDQDIKNDMNDKHHTDEYNIEYDESFTTPPNEPTSNLKQTSGPDQKYMGILPEQKPDIPVILPNNTVTLNHPSTSFNQTEQSNSPYNPVPLQSNKPPTIVDQHGGDHQNPMIISTAQQLSQPDENIPKIQPNTPLTQLKDDQNPVSMIGHTNLTENTSPFNTSNPTTTMFDQQTGYKPFKEEKTTSHNSMMASDKSFGSTKIESNSLPTNFSQQSDHKESHQLDKNIPHFQSSTPRTSFNQNLQKCPAQMVAPTSADISINNFQSVVPPLLIPSSKVSEYLPEGMVNQESWIPLPLKPVIVIKDQIVVMVFEKDDGKDINTMLTTSILLGKYIFRRCMVV